jgi:hypothetical protein
LAHKNRETAPRGIYNEDYHHYLYQQTLDGNYNCYKVVVAMNGSARQILQEQLTKEEYFKRKLDGTLKNDGAEFRDGV